MIVRIGRIPGAKAGENKAKRSEDAGVAFAEECLSSVDEDSHRRRDR